MGSRAAAWIRHARWRSSDGGRRPLFVTACIKLSLGLKKQLVLVQAREWYSSPHKFVMTNSSSALMGCTLLSRPELETWACFLSLCLPVAQTVDVRQSTGPGGTA